MYEIKQTLKDFIVEEITPTGEIMKTDFENTFRESKGKYLICKLVKKNWDNQQAIKAISNQLHMSYKQIGIAGTKDKRALTAQRISIPTTLEKIKQVNIKDIKLEPLYFSDKSLMLGDLKGNHFKIKVITNQDIKPLTKFPNYFGEQRFGKTRPITGLVGEQIIKRNYEEAVKIYVASVYEAEEQESKQARQFLFDNWGNFKEALEKFPKHLKYERTMLTHLVEKPTDYSGAINALPRGIRRMLVHAYQSILFNEFLDKVIQDKLEYKEGPLYGFETKFNNPLEREIIEKHGIEREDFILKDFDGLTSRGNTRKLFVSVDNFKILESTNDYKVIEFDLPKGSYATVFLEYLFKE